MEFVFREVSVLHSCTVPAVVRYVRPGYDYTSLK